MPSPRSPWPVGTLALVGVCAAGMAVGAVLALTPPEPEPLRLKGPAAGHGPSPYGLAPPPPAVPPSGGLAPMSAVGPPAPVATDAVGPRSR